MDPVSALVTALAIGAGAAMKKVGGEVGGDLYRKLKDVLAKHCLQLDTAAIETDPASPEAKRDLERRLMEANVAEDPEARDAAAALLRYAEEEPDLAQRAGVNIERIRAGSVALRRITTERLNVRDVKAREDFVLEDVNTPTTREPRTR